MNFDLYKHTVFLTISGSQAYGLATPESDYDYRGIAIAPIESYIGIKEKFEQAVDSKTKHVYKHFPEGLLKTIPGEFPDMQIMELSKFVRLALDNNPSVIETLFIDSKFHTIKNPIIDQLINERDKFLSKKCKSRFAGYAFGQLQRIKRHKLYLDNGPVKKPTRSEFGLPEHGLINQDQLGAVESIIQKSIHEFILDQTSLSEELKIEIQLGLEKMMKAIWASINPSKEYPIGYKKQFPNHQEALFWGEAYRAGFSENFLEVLAAERKYRAAQKEYENYKEWEQKRNPKRAELEKKFGMDCKHAAHLVRLLNCSREILTTGTLTVERPEADLLKGIRNGAWSYEQLVEFAEKEDEEQNKLLKTSSLRANPDYDYFDQIVRNIILEFHK